MSVQEALGFLPLLGAAVALLGGALALRQGPHPLVTGCFVAGMWGMAASEVAAFLAQGAAAGGGPAIPWLLADLGIQCLATLAWLAFAMVFAAASPWGALRRWRWWAMAAAALAVGFVGILGLGLGGTPVRLRDGGGTVFALSAAGRGLFIFLLLGGLAVLVLLENTFRNASGPDRWRTKYLLLGLAAGLGFQIYTSSQALLFPALRPGLISARSAALLVATLLIGYSLARRGLFGVTVFVSRQFVYGSATASIVGAYLLAMGAAAEAFRRFDIPLDRSVKAVAVLVAGVALAVVLLSSRFRRRLQLFIATHFYRHKYDYRRTWIDFTRRLGGAVRQEDILPRIAEMVAGTVWVRSVAIWTYDAERRQFDPGAAIAVEAPPVPGGGEVGEALRERGRPVLPEDLPGLPLSPESRGGLAALLARTGFVALVPLATKEELVGLIGVGPEASGKPFVHEDWQLLTTIAGQAAGAIMAARLSDRLLAAREMEAFHRVSAFVLHDLKNAIGMLRLLLDNARDFMEEPAFRRDALTTIEGAVNRMEGLMRKLSGAPAPAQRCPTPVDLNAVVRTAMAACPLGKGPGVTVAEALGPLPPLQGDGAELQSVVSNLLLNAAEALEGRPGTVTVRTGQEGAWAVLAVSDTGKGIDETFRRQSLFRPFCTTKPKGLGIGLYQCKVIVEAHGGQIQVESANGKGTTFTVRLPLRGEAGWESDARGAAVAGGQGAGR